MASNKQTEVKPSNNILRGILFGVLAMALCLGAVWQRGWLVVPALQKAEKEVVIQKGVEEKAPAPTATPQADLAPITEQIVAITAVIDGLGNNLDTRLHALEASLTAPTPKIEMPALSPLEQALDSIGASTSLMVLEQAYFKGKNVTPHLQKLAEAAPELAENINFIIASPATTKRHLMHLLKEEPAPEAAPENLSWWKALLQKFVTIRQIPKAENKELRRLIYQQKWADLLEKTDKEDVQTAITSRQQQEAAWQGLNQQLHEALTQ